MYFSFIMADYEEFKRPQKRTEMPTEGIDVQAYFPHIASNTDFEILARGIIRNRNAVEGEIAGRNSADEVRLKQLYILPLLAFDITQDLHDKILGDLSQVQASSRDDTLYRETITNRVFGQHTFVQSAHATLGQISANQATKLHEIVVASGVLLLRDEAPHFADLRLL